MPKLALIQTGHGVLRQRAQDVTSEQIRTEAFRNLVQIMVTAMREAPGVGLAAPQLGLPLRVIVLEDTERLMRFLTPAERAERGREPFPLQVFVNPVLKPLSEAKASLFEGCLSVPGFEAEVERYLSVEVSGLDETGAPKLWRADGWPARIAQHEVDHINGQLYIDVMKSRTFTTFGGREQQSLAALKQSLGITLA
jgi:peptide deformylase